MLRQFPAAIFRAGHGESAWIDGGDYSYQAFASDLLSVTQEVTKRFGQSPVLVGASLGGLSGLIASGLADNDPFAALVLVDITPKPDPKGVQRILDFMGAYLEQGFGTLEEASDVVAAYMPNRKRPVDIRGLEKNLRRHEDGRYRWHWDPAFMRERLFSQEDEDRLMAAARGVKAPVLLVRGLASDLVGVEQVRAFQKLVPHARFVDVADAGHMVAGDKNTVFADAVIDFITALNWGV